MPSERVREGEREGEGEGGGQCAGGDEEIEVELVKAREHDIRDRHMTLSFSQYAPTLFPTKLNQQTVWLG